MTTEQYSIGYDEGYQTGWNDAVEGESVSLAKHVIGCFEAAEGEGLHEALAETTDERLKDLVERRLMYALYAAQDQMLAYNK